MAAMAAATLAALMATQVATGSRQDDGFSTDKTTFLTQMADMFEQSADKKRAETAMAQMQEFVNTGDAELVEMMMETCGKVRKLKGRAFPDYVTVLGTYDAMSRNLRIGGENMKVWKTVLDKKSK